MKTVYFVTEGKTDQIVLEGLISTWLGEQDFLARVVQPPSSAYAEELDSALSEGWKGVVAWCQGARAAGPAGRNEVISKADCLFIHIDADVAFDPDFKNPLLKSTLKMPEHNATT